MGGHSSTSASRTCPSVRRGSATRVRAARSLRCPPTPYTYHVRRLTCTACDAQTRPREGDVLQARTSRFGTRCEGQARSSGNPPSSALKFAHPDLPPHVQGYRLGPPSKTPLPSLPENALEPPRQRIVRPYSRSGKRATFFFKDGSWGSGGFQSASWEFCARWADLTAEMGWRACVQYNTSLSWRISNQLETSDVCKAQVRWGIPAQLLVLCNCTHGASKQAAHDASFRFACVSKHFPPKAASFPPPPQT